MEVFYTAAKVNFFLRIGAKGRDGDHDLTSVMQSVAFFDRVAIAFGQTEFSLRVVGGDAGPVAGNIVTKTWRLLKETFSLPGEIAVSSDKRLPVAAGLAGGTGNGAAIFQAVADRYVPGLMDRPDLARRIGSDMPFCLRGGTALVEGSGEKVSALSPPPPMWLLLVNPGFPIATKALFAAYDEAPPPQTAKMAQVAAVRRGDWAWLRRDLRNDFTGVALKTYPELENIYAWFRAGGYRPLLSGSGPSVYAIVDDAEQARAYGASLPPAWGRAWTVKTAEKGVYREREIVAGEAGTVSTAPPGGIWALRRPILSGHFKPGDRLLMEVQVADELGSAARWCGKPSVF